MAVYLFYPFFVWQPGMVTTDLLMSGANTKQVDYMQPSYFIISAWCFELTDLFFYAGKVFH